MKLVDLEKALKTATSIDQVNQAMQHYLKLYNINTFAYTYYSYHPTSQNKLKYDYSTSNFVQWHKHYIDENYHDIDSTLAIVYQASLPIFWDLQKQLQEAKNPREKQMRLDSIAFGTEKGLAIPIHGPQEDFAVLLLVQMRGQSCLENWQELQFEFLSAAYYYYFYMQRELLKYQSPVSQYQLNKRETQCLTLLAKQYSTETIAKTLKITERTVNYHIQRLNKKFGTQNKYQTVIKALQKGLIVL